MTNNRTNYRRKEKRRTDKEREIKEERNKERQEKTNQQQQIRIVPKRNVMCFCCLPRAKGAPPSGHLSPRPVTPWANVHPFGASGSPHARGGPWRNSLMKPFSWHVSGHKEARRNLDSYMHTYAHRCIGCDPRNATNKGRKTQERHAFCILCIPCLG